MATNGPQRIFDFYPLEDRILLSGEGFDGDVVEVDPALTDALLAEIAAGEATVESAPEDNVDNRLDSDEFADRIDFNTALPIEVVFVDAGVQDAETLIAGLRESGESQTQWVVVELSADEDGVDQITRTLAELSGVDAVHIVSHGDGEGIQLGNTRLDVDTAAGYASDIASWADSLDADADLLIYGCDLASTADGRALIDSIGALCECDVAASDDATGAKDLGGDWDLEYGVGVIDTEIAFTSQTQATWQGLLATYTVTNINDSGAGSLRDAIDQSNASVGITDTIDFSISGAGVHTISLDTALPYLTDDVILDATTQAGGPFTTPLIELVKSGSYSGPDTAAINVRANNSTVSGFIVGGWGDEGIEVDGSTGKGDNNLIELNWVGFDGLGAASGVAGDGILITVNADNNVVRNNVVGNSGASGIRMRTDSDDNWVWGNTVGLGTDGLTDHGNTDHGIYIEGNSARNIIGTNGDATNDATEGNTISGNSTGGMYITGAGTDDTIIAGNQIGTDSTGTILIGNSGNNVNINQDASDTIVGGAGAFQGNVIVGGADGITIWQIGTTGTIVQGNYIGTDVTGTLDWGNSGSGVVISGWSNNNVIGGVNPGEGNVIAFNNFGVAIWDPGSDNNAILGNSIYRNDGLGIEIEGVGVNPNDNNDSDSGANDEQNYPVFTTVSHLLGNTTVNFDLNTNQAGNYHIEFFVSDLADESGHGEGQTLVHSEVFSHTGSGNESFVTTAFATSDTAIISATATKDLGGGNYGSTSEFSAVRNAQNGGVLVVDTTNDLSNGDTSSVANLINNKGDGVISLREAIEASNAVPGTFDIIQFDIDPGGLQTIVMTAVLDNITDAVYLDATTQSGYVGAPLIELDGSVTTGAQNGITLSATAAGSTVTGFIVHSFADEGIEVLGDNNTVQNNWVGLDSTGLASDPNGGDGIILAFGAAGNLIGGAGANEGNVVAGNTGAGITLRDAGTDGNFIYGNLVGVGTDGVTAVANGSDGIWLSTAVANNFVGGTAAGQENVVSGNANSGILVSNAGAGNTIAGNLIGTDQTGLVDVGNTGHGLEIVNTASTVIGGNTADHRNVISGNDLSGISLWGATTTLTAIQGNYIGVDITGASAMGNNHDGVRIAGSANANTVGGDRTAGEANVISGNLNDGIELNDLGTDNNLIYGNYIGTDHTGTIDVGNVRHGVVIYNGVQATEVGGTGTGQGNIISGNNDTGIIVDGNGGATTTSNIIAGNFIGTDVTGTVDLGNTDKGIDLFGGATGNTIGGTVVAARNVISGNDANGILIQGAGTDFNQVLGNYIGIDATGTGALGNTWAGVSISSDASNNDIGDGTAAGRNIISGNQHGVSIGGATSSDNRLRGNYIGTDATGTLDLGNTWQGINAGGANTIIGGIGQGNVISGNNSRGIYVSSATGLVIQGNYIGTNAAGTAAIANNEDGINIVTAGVQIGGTAAGEGNVISGNAWSGISLSSGSAIGNTVEGNIIGLDATGTAIVANGTHGVHIAFGANNNTIGGTVAGARNIISGNTNGVYINSAGSDANTVAGNYIGTDITGTLDRGNTSSGVYINSGASNVIDNNVISGNDSYGIYVNGASAIGNTITGNLVGLNAAGTASLLNGDDAIYLNVADTTQIGGNTAADRNVINAAAGQHGIYTFNATDTTIEGNYLGTDNSGATALSGGSFALNISGSSNTTIGGTTAAEANVIAGYSVTGINIDGAGSSGTTVEGNFIGTDVGGTLDLTSGLYGVALQLSVTGVTIGGTAAGAGNTIAYNGTNGVRLMSTAGSGNAIRQNLIYSNGGIGIDLEGDGITANDAGDGDSGANDLMNFAVIYDAQISGPNVTITGEAAAGSTVEFYKVADDGDTHGEAAEFLGSGLVVGATPGIDDPTARQFSFVLAVGSLTSTDAVTATVTDAANNTSEFSFNVDVNNPITAISDSDAGANVVLENAVVGTTVGVTALADDSDAEDTISYSLDDNDGGRFTINSSTGVVTVNGAIDREADGASRNITVRATSTDTSFTTQVFAIAITDVDEFDVGAVTDTDVTTNAVNENATVGTVVGIDASASDADATNNTITYSLQDNDGGRFAINSSTGVVTVNGAIDREADGASRNITVRATSSDTSFTDQVFAIAINDVDEFDVGAVTDTDVTADAVNENATVGTVVGIDAAASDADATNNTITYSLQDNDGGRFAINSSTGVVTVNGAIDREADGASRNITVRATSSDTSFTDQVYAIAINDVDEFDVGAVTDTDAAANAVNENATVGTVVGIDASASDADATNNTITYSLFDDDGGRFTINSSTGVVTVNGAIDREAGGPSRNITVRATSSDTSFTDQVYAIAINDVDEFDVTATTDSDVTANAVNENAIVGTVVGVTASASDADATDTITFSLDDNDGGRFAINASTGVVTVASGIDREADGASRNITVRSTSSDTSFSTQVFAININDVDEFDVGAVTDTDVTANAVNENATVGTVVGIDASASDADATNNTITYSLQDNDGGRFAINSSTGVVTVNGAIDREADGASRNITVRATSSDLSFTDQVYAIAINDVDEFNVGAVTDTDATIDAVNENATVGTVVGIDASAGDADATNNTITYSLQDNDGGRFAINSSTGVVTVNGAIDREADGPSRNITVRATSSDTSFTDQVYAIAINDVDEFDVGTVTDTDVTLDAVNENATVGTVVGIDVSASDADATNNTITYSLQDNDGGRFAINSSTGVVTVNGAIDREADGASRNITVRATSSDLSFTDQVYAIAINDVDEFNVGAVTDTDAAANAVNENATVGTVVGIDASANDADATNNTITYSLQDNDGGRFAINSSTGVVTVNGAIDREADGASRNITVRATSSDTSFTDQIFAIAIGDVDEFDVGAVTDTDVAVNAVNENATVGTVVGITASASDADATVNTITYFLQDNDGGRFAIHSSTGVVTVAGAIDREADGASRSITVRAFSADTSFTDQVFAITINDVDEFDIGAVSDSDVATDEVNESAANGTAVGITALATDSDATDNTTYTLDDTAGGRFAINATTGVITVANTSLLDYETTTSHNVTVRATSDDASFSTAIVAINLLDDTSESGAGPISDTDATANSLAENSLAGATVGITAFATDADITDTISYSLDDNAGGRFAINAATGIVTLLGGIDAESATSHNIIVRATSTDTSFSTAGFVINITDVDEFDVGPISDTDAAGNSVAENAIVGASVGVTALANDADVSDNITYSLDDTAGGRFAINSSTGVVTVAAALDAESFTSHNITVRATSDDTSFSTMVIAIAVTDIDEFDVGAVTDADVTVDAVNENAIVGTTVGITASASDSDVTTNTITYSLQDNDGGRFAINSSTGVVTVAGAIDREADGGSRNITVRATSADLSFTDQVFAIAINDLDEFNVGTVTDTDATIDAVNENATVGTVVGVTASASDADATNNTITYSLQDNDGGRFAINSSTGVVTVAGAIDREADGASRNITVRATSSDLSFTDQVIAIAINDVDEFDVGVVTDSDATSNAVNENATVGTVVGIDVAASDADATTNAITYSLQDNDGGRFTINSSTGVVTVAGVIDREADGASRNITVRATSADLSFTDQVFAIAINDVDEYDVGAITDTDVTVDAVNENATVGTVVGIDASASDADATNNAITYSLQDNDGGRFAINSSTGVVTVNGAIDRETDGASRNITVRATSSDSSFTDRVIAIAINDVDEFDATAITDSDLTVNAINENATVGTVVGVTASSDDADATDTITYTLDDNDGGRFTINSSTGVVTVAGAIDREADGATRSIVVRSTSTDASFTTQAFVININDVDEFDVGSVTDTDLTLNAVNENATVGTVVGIDALASDADATNNAITYSLQDNDGGRFAINASTGVVTVNGAIDREADGASRNITVRATSSDSSFTDQVFAIAINDVDEFNVGAVTDTDVTVNAVSENATVGTAVGIDATASDADATNNAITYSLQDNDGGRFAINSSTGVVTVAGAIDREADGASRNITVRATSTDLSFTDQVFAIAINDVDEFDVGAVTDTNLSANAVNENAIVGTVVGITASASDADATTNAITYSLFDNDGGRFAINSSTGVVTVAGAIDREADGASRNITVRATSTDTSFTDQVFAININDLDEFDITAVVDTDATTDEVNESAANGTAVGITALASDADATDNTTYTLDDTAGGRFAINSTTGIITVANTSLLDYETTTSHNVTVRATSDDASFSTAIFTINLLDDTSESGAGPISDTDATANSLAENALAGATVGITAFATDADITDTISYSLDDNAGGRFAINATTGVVTLLFGIDAESATSHNIIVRATSTDTSFSTAGFVINITDVDEFDVGVVSDTDVTVDAVNENATVGTLVGVTAFAQDLDVTTNTITYSLQDNDGGRFAINSSTGVVTVAGAIDREADGGSRNITVRATSADSSFTDQVYVIGINDVDEFDVGAVTDTDLVANAVNENATVGTVVGITSAASDADATTNAITYSLQDNDGGRFAINASTGIVTVAGAIDREADGASRNITVRATSADSSFTDQVFAININDVDEFDVGAVSDADVTADAVNENATVGTVVGITAAASDADATTNAITYSLQDNDGGRFAINASTGVVTVAGAIDREADGASRNITVRATSSDSSFTDQVFAININDVDEFDVGPVTDVNGAANAVAENAVIGTAVGITAAASDADATNNAITYSLQDNDGGRFAVNASTGVVTVAGAIDREADGPTRNITVRAASSDGSFTDQVMAISIIDVDEFDVGAVSDTDITVNAVNENAAIGTGVGIDASASDADATNNTITYSLQDNDGGRFAINSTTGVVTVNGSIDREADGPSRNITVRATSSDSSFTDQIFAINVNDVDEFDVGLVTDTDAAANAVNENAVVGTAVGITAAASDADATNNAITYSLLDNDGGRFAINSSTGVVTVAGAIDREADGASRNITVRASSTDGSFTDQVVAININDVDEFNTTATLDVDATTNGVDENALIGTVVGITASANDADATNNTITYSLDNNDGGRFAINSSTGVVTVAGAIDREVDGASRNITVRSTSSDASFTTAIFAIGINDVDEFDVTTPIDSDLAANFVNENSAFGTTVGLTAFADDSDVSDSVTYSLDDDAGGRFAINSSTGLVTVSGAIDFETAANHNVTVRAISTDGSFATQVFTINVGDINEAPVASDDAYSVNSGDTLTVATPGVLAGDFDVDGDPLMAILVTPAANGAMSLLADGTLVYTPNTGFFGVDTIQYQVSDGSLLSNVVSVNITVIAGGIDPDPDPDPIPDPDPDPDDDDDPIDEEDDADDDESTDDSDTKTTDDSSSTSDPALELSNVVGQPTESETVLAESDHDQAAWLREFYSHASSRHGGVGAEYSMQLEMFGRLLQLDLEQAIVWQQWDQSTLADDGSDLRFYAGAAGVASGLFSVGYVMWALRGGAFVAAVTSTVPSWRLVDPAAMLSAYRASKAIPKDRVESMLG